MIQDDSGSPYSLECKSLHLLEIAEKISSASYQQKTYLFITRIKQNRHWTVVRHVDMHVLPECASLDFIA